MMEKLGPGVYDGLPIEFYHGDCCKKASVSSTGIRKCARDPFLYWQDSPLNPAVQAREAEEKKKRAEEGAPPPPAAKFRKFANSSAAHLMYLEPDLVASGVSVIPDDLLASNGALSTKAAKAFVAEQSEAGRVVLKNDEWLRICDMADALAAHSTVRKLTQDVAVEQSHIWEDVETGVYLKSRPDITANDPDAWIVDYKTTEIDDLADWDKSSTCNTRLDMQAALQITGANVTRGHNPPGVCYIIQNVKTARIAVRTIRADSDMIRAARHDLRRGVNAFAHCLQNDDWSGPWEMMDEVTPPDWRQRQIERQLENETGILPGAFGF